MKVRMLNGPRGVVKSVMWKDGQDSVLERKEIRVVDICIGEDVLVKAAVEAVEATEDNRAVEAESEVWEFQPRQAVQRMQFSEETTAIQITTAVKVRAKELEKRISVVPVPVDIDLEVN